MNQDGAFQLHGNGGALKKVNEVRTLLAGHASATRVSLMCMLPGQVIGGMISHLMELGASYHASHDAGRLLIVQELARQQRGFVKRALAKLSSTISRRPRNPSLLDLLKAHERSLLAYAVGRSWCKRANSQALTQWCV